jgi:activator of HSP90 ATPase
VVRSGYHGRAAAFVGFLRFQQTSPEESAMPRIVKQTVTLPAPAKDLYAMYLNPGTHGAFTGGKVVIGARPGAKFSAFGGALRGKMLQTVPGRLIVQAWRSTAFKTTDADSTLILRFTPKGRSGRIDLVHVNVPNHDYGGVNKGWKNYYWKPWRKYLSRRSSAFATARRAALRRETP